jgi:broad specificity phosphatase PhoE
VSAVTLFMLRHGAHDQVRDVLCGRAEDVGLGERGRAQVKALAARLSAERLTAVYSSPIQRTRETAATVARPHGLDIALEPALIELDFGDWTGARFADLDDHPSWRRWNGDRGRSRAPSGESMLDAQRRVALWLDVVRERHVGEIIAAVSHGDVIKATVAYALGLPLHFHDRFEISPGSMTTLMLRDAELSVVAMNEVPRENEASHG